MDRSYKLEILPPAQEELEEIARLHRTLVGPESARKITDNLYAWMETLMRFPLSGRPVEGGRVSVCAGGEIPYHLPPFGGYGGGLPYCP